MSKFCVSFQERRAKVTEEKLDHFMTPRALLCHGVTSDTLLPSSRNKTGSSQDHVKDPNSKSQLKKLKKAEAVNAKKAKKAEEKGTGSTTTTETVPLQAKDATDASSGTLSST